MSAKRARLPEVCWLLALSACGGQSGNEGDLPAAPCARDNAFVVGRIEEVGAGCVSVRVERVVSAGMPLPAADGGVRSDGEPEVGELLRGRLGTIYSYDHEFERADSVALFVEPWGDDAIALQLFPVDGDRVQIHWAGQRLELEVAEMVEVDCQSKLEARRKPSDDVRHGGGGSVQTSPAEPEPMCGPARIE
jgi:hypothetical protein